MTVKEVHSLNAGVNSPLNEGQDNFFVAMGFCGKANEYYVKIGPAKYYKFAEAQAILNNLERHIEQ